jgi:hypothetical protein
MSAAPLASFISIAGGVPVSSLLGGSTMDCPSFFVTEGTVNDSQPFSNIRNQGEQKCSVKCRF